VEINYSRERGKKAQIKASSSLRPDEMVFPSKIRIGSERLLLQSGLGRRESLLSRGKAESTRKRLFSRSSPLLQPSR